MFCDVFAMYALLCVAMLLRCKSSESSGAFLVNTGGLVSSQPPGPFENLQGLKKTEESQHLETKHFSTPW